jgi:hypothetical protein
MLSRIRWIDAALPGRIATMPNGRRHASSVGVAIDTMAPR